MRWWSFFIQSRLARSRPRLERTTDISSLSRSCWFLTLPPWILTDTYPVRHLKPIGMRFKLGSSSNNNMIIILKHISSWSGFANTLIIGLDRSILTDTISAEDEPALCNNSIMSAERLSASWVFRDCRISWSNLVCSWQRVQACFQYLGVVQIYRTILDNNICCNFLC